MWSNFHTHSHYCDGKGAPAEYLEEARKAGVRHIGFSSHAPLPFYRKWSMQREAFAAYLAEIESLKVDFPDLEIYKGLEIDYVPELISPANFSPHLDYTIGSIHFVDGYGGDHWEIDNTAAVFRDGLAQIFGNNIRKALSRYFELTREMLHLAPPDVLGHLDKIKINSLGVFFDESEDWYREEVDKTLAAVKETHVIVEVNTRGLYKKKSPTPYPSPWILERIFNLRIPVTLNSDAHHSEDLVREFPQTLKLLRDIGFKSLSVLKEGSWTETRIDDYGAH